MAKASVFSIAILGAMLLALFLLRLPTALVPREFNVDESQIISDSMRFILHPEPWRSVDEGSSGPLNYGLMSLLLLLGFKPGYVLAHILASGFICLQVLVGYLTLRQLASEYTALFGGFLMVFLYGVYTHPHYVAYGTEVLPTLLLTFAFLMLVGWLGYEGPSCGRRLSLLFVAGVALGAAPWCKLQAVPISVALGLFTLVALFRRKSEPSSSVQRWRELLAFICGAALTSAIMLIWLAWSGAVQEFWYSYVLSNLAYAGGRISSSSGVENIARLLLLTPVHQLLLVALLGIALLNCASSGASKSSVSNTQKWGIAGVLTFACGAVFSACRVKFFWPEHAIFVIPPVTYISAILASSGTAAFNEYRKRERVTGGRVVAMVAPGLLAAAVVALFAAYGVRYANMLGRVGEWRFQPSDSAVRKPRAAERLGSSGSSDAAFMATWIGPPRWRPGDSNERISAVVHDLRQRGPIRSLAIWGWAPGVYVLTGLSPATRYAVFGAPLADTGAFRAHFTGLFLSDLRANPPDLFIDAVSRDAFMWRWTERDGYESEREVRDFIDTNYTLFDQLILVQGAKPIRFFVRRKPAPATSPW